jgi:hypothetical protein
MQQEISRDLTIFGSDCNIFRAVKSGPSLFDDR